MITKQTRIHNVYLKLITQILFVLIFHVLEMSNVLDIRLKSDESEKYLKVVVTEREENCVPSYAR